MREFGKHLFEARTNYEIRESGLKSAIPNAD
jgi:hypothetical protein